jgi:hypothetical protein
VRQLVKTLVDQAHLSPLPLHVRPLFWELDQSLWLYPVPDLLVLGDKFEAYQQEYGVSSGAVRGCAGPPAEGLWPATVAGRTGHQPGLLCDHQLWLLRLLPASVSGGAGDGWLPQPGRGLQPR